MEILKDLSQRKEGCLVAIGSFDGVHKGHKEIIETMVKDAKQQGLSSVVLTFSPHPLEVISPKDKPSLLSLDEERIRLIEEIGPDTLLILPFNETMASLTAEEFVNNILVDKLNVKGVYVGYNFTFGNGGKGNIEELAKYGKKYGFAVRVFDPIFVEGEVVSSTLIRQQLDLGNVGLAAKFLDRWYSVKGTIVEGNKKGREIGFPTANLSSASEKLQPADGVYVVNVKIGDNNYAGVANIGKRPTVEEHRKDSILEVHILDVSLDLYGQMLEVEFLKRLRLEKKFPSLEALREQQLDDIEFVRKFWSELLA